MKRGKPLSRRGARAKREAADLDKFREAVLERAQGVCERCGQERYLTAHHIVSRARAPGWPGLHAPENGAALCLVCHNKAHLDPLGNPQWIKSAPPL